MTGNSIGERPDQRAGRVARVGAKADKLTAMAGAVNHWGVRRLTATRLLRGALSLCYPPTCVLCGAPGWGALDLCHGCWADLPALGACCRRCALPLPLAMDHGDAVSSRSGAERSNERGVGTRSNEATASIGAIKGRAAGGFICGQCQRSPPPFDQGLALFRYEGLVRALIADFKFHQRLPLGRLFGQLLAETARWQPQAALPEVLVPVPLHRRRLRERGYNQSLEVARVIGRELKIPVDGHGVERAFSTPPQLSLAREQRLVNVRDAFRVRATRSARHVAIIDDVVTTAATVGELARALRQAGAERIDVWAIARTP